MSYNNYKIIFVVIFKYLGFTYESGLDVLKPYLAQRVGMALKADNGNYLCISNSNGAYFRFQLEATEAKSKYHCKFFFEKV